MGAKRLLSDIVSLTPSNYENFTRCPRLFYCRDLLGIPASDETTSADQGLQLHDMLRKIHRDGECHDASEHQEREHIRRDDHVRSSCTRDAKR